MKTLVAESLPLEVLTKLFAVLKSWADGMDAFRYEMFARRLVAAEHGRSDAVAWAQSWYSDVLAGECQIEEARQLVIQENAQRDALARSEFQAGRCGNPNYQAFLDTVEHPELIEHHAPYMAWISSLLARFERVPGLRDLPKSEQHALWQKTIQEARDANLAPRLKNRQACHKADLTYNPQPLSLPGGGFLNS